MVTVAQDYSGGQAARRVKRESHERSGSHIPFVYKSRDKVRVIPSGDSYLAVCDLPLNAVRVNAQAIRILKSCDGTRSITGIAREAGIAREEDVLRVCEYFRERGFLEQEAAPDTGFRPSVTVIIPVRDRPEELSECLASVFAQEYPRELMEVIVVDDGSTDDTPEVARRFPCMLLSNASSRGQSYCRNMGAREASGEILAFLDSDCAGSPSCSGRSRGRQPRPRSTGASWPPTKPSGSPPTPAATAGPHRCSSTWPAPWRPTTTRRRGLWRPGWRRSSPARTGASSTARPPPVPRATSSCSRCGTSPPS